MNVNILTEDGAFGYRPENSLDMSSDVQLITGLYEALQRLESRGVDVELELSGSALEGYRDYKAQFQDVLVPMDRNYLGEYTAEELFRMAGIDKSPKELNVLIEYLDLSLRTYNCLRKVNIDTVGDLIIFSENDLEAIKGFGLKCSFEVEEKLGDRGYKLRDESDVPDKLTSSTSIADFVMLMPNCRVQAYQFLQIKGIKTVGELCELTEPDLLILSASFTSRYSNVLNSFRGHYDPCDSVKETLANYGFSLK